MFKAETKWREGAFAAARSPNWPLNTASMSSFSRCDHDTFCPAFHCPDTLCPNRCSFSPPLARCERGFLGALGRSAGSVRRSARGLDGRGCRWPCYRPSGSGCSGLPAACGGWPGGPNAAPPRCWRSRPVRRAVGGGKRGAGSRSHPAALGGRCGARDRGGGSRGPVRGAARGSGSAGLGQNRRRATAARSAFEVTRRFAAPPERVWPVVRDMGRIGAFYPALQSVTLDGTGAGAPPHLHDARRPAMGRAGHRVGRGPGVPTRSGSRPTLPTFPSP